MNPTIAVAISQGIAALIQIWRENASHPPEWQPTDQDWNDMLALNEKPTEDYVKEARARLGLPPV